MQEFKSGEQAMILERGMSLIHVKTVKFLIHGGEILIIDQANGHREVFNSWEEFHEEYQIV